VYTRDTIAAVATPPGAGGIGIIRLSGAQAVAIAAEVFRSHGTGRTPASHEMRRGHVVDSHGGSIDEALCVAMLAPHSYTGEDVVELHCHGSPVVLRRVLQRCLQCGARAAEPGEFTKRAFLNGCIDLVQAEAVAELINARTEAAARASLRQLSGSLSVELAAIREMLVRVKARAEVLIDFAEEEVDMSPPLLAADVDAAAARIEALLATFRSGRLLREGIHLTLLGRPNVGKSSLLNRLLGRDRAIVAATPGTTRDVVIDSTDIEGVPVVVADTAGLRSNADEVERLGIERTHRQAASADALLVVLDRSAPLGADDAAIFATIGDTPALVALNKTDLGPLWRIAEAPFLAGRVVVETSALTGEGLPELRRAILTLAGGAAIDLQAPLLTLARHHDALARALDSLSLARTALLDGTPIDVTAVDIQAAVEHIGSITGEVTTEEVLDRIFREFCIGK